MTSRSRRAASHRVPSAGLLAVGVVVSLVIGAGLAAGRSSMPVAAQETPGVGTAELQLVEQNFSIEPGGTITLVYRLTGVDDDALDLVPDPPVTEPPVTEPPADPTLPVEPEPVVPEPVVLTLEVTNYQPVVDPDDVSALVGSDVDPGAFTGAVDGVAISAVRELATVDADGSVRLELSIPTDVVNSVEERLKFDLPGLYPLRTQLLVGDPADDNVVATAGTIVQRLAGPTDVAPSPPITLSVVTVVPAPRPNATDDEIAGASSVLDEAISLAATLDAPVTLEVPPPLVATKAATPDGQAELAASLEGDELVALPIVPLDVSSAVAAGQGELFARLLSAGQDVLTAAVPTTPSRRDVWITSDALSAGGAQQLRDLGVRFVVMPASLYRESIGPRLPRSDLFVGMELPDGDTLPLLVVGSLAAELTPEAADELLERSTALEWAVGTAAELLVGQLAADQTEAAPVERSVILTTPNLRAPDVRLLTGLQQIVATTPSMRFGPASSLIGSTDQQTSGGQPLTVELPETAGPSLVERIERIDTTALKMISAASMLPADDPRPPQWAAELDQLISTGYTDDDVEAATAALAAQADALTAAVELPEPFTFTLTGRSGTIELRFDNTSDESLDVLVQLDSTKMQFPDGDRVVSLRPNAETSIEVPVEARSNGTSSIELVVSTPAGQPIGEPVTFTSRVTGFTGLGFLLTGGLILVLLSWWFTHVRARRRAALLGDGRVRHPAGRKVGSDAL